MAAMDRLLQKSCLITSNAKEEFLFLKSNLLPDRPQLISQWYTAKVWRVLIALQVSADTHDLTRENQLVLTLHRRRSFFPLLQCYGHISEYKVDNIHLHECSDRKGCIRSTIAAVPKNHFVEPERGYHILQNWL